MAQKFAGHEGMPLDSTMDLKPPETTQRILISSTSRFIAEYEAEGILITHAWPDLYAVGGSLRLDEGPGSRSAYMLSFTTPEVKKEEGAVLPNYQGIGEWVCSLLSLLFGKRFDSHGCVQSNGFFSLPNLAQFTSLCIPTLPQNDHKVRSDIAIPLDLREIARIEPILIGHMKNTTQATALNAAAKFYYQALQNAESDPEIAYLHLITGGEILANAHHPQNDDLLDEEIRAVLDHVRKLVPDGEKAARKLASRMRQIKRRFRSTIDDLIDERFFHATEHETQWARLKPEELSSRVSAAYDIRSRYVHTGLAFGSWISPQRGPRFEIQLGRPVVADKTLADLLETAPTYVGLERVIRYCLLRFAERHELVVGGRSNTA